MDTLIRCDICGRKFDPHHSPVDVIRGNWICCGDDYTPEELAEKLGLEVGEVYKSLGLEEEK